VATEPSVFSLIVRGELPCHKVYEDGNVLAFMDIRPVQPGMVVVVTKRQVANFYELTDMDYDAFTSAIKRVAARLAEVFPNKKRIALQIEGLDVAHVHAKLFPVDTGAQFRSEPDMEAEPDHAALAVLAEKLRFS